MSALDGLWYRLRTLLRPRTTEAERHAEFEFHLAQDALHQGESRLAARRRFGNATGYRQDLRRLSGLAVVDRVTRNLRFAVRGLRRSPAYVVTAVLTEALGLAAAAGIGAVAYGVLLRPLPYPEPDRLVAVEHFAPGLGPGRQGVSDGLYLEYTRAGVFSAIGLYQENDGVALTDRDEPIRLRVAVVTASALRLLGPSPAAGRLFADSDGSPGAPPTVLISHALWVTRYGADPGIVGRTLELNRARFLVVGVMPADFGWPNANTAVWYSQHVDPSEANVRGLYYHAIARLKRGQTERQAESAMRVVVRGVVDRYPDAAEADLRQARIEPVVTPLGAALVRDVRRPLMLLAITGGLVLVIAGANLTNLVLIRSERQRRDVALGHALGGTALDATGRVVAELAVIGLLAALLAVIIAAAAIGVHFGFDPDQVPRLGTVKPDGVVVVFVAALSVVVSFGLAAIALARLRGSELPASLASHATRATDGRRLRALHRTLVVAQIALAATLLIGAVAMVAAIERLRRVPLGFDPERRVTLGLDLPFQPYPSFLAGARFYEALLGRLRQIPGVQSAEAAAALPLSADPAWFDEATLEPDEAPLAPGEPAVAGVANVVTPGYFQSLGIPILSGRSFAAGDLADGAPNVILGASLARRLFRGADALGRRVRYRAARSPWYRVVGVVGDVPGRSIPEGPASLIYFPAVDDPTRARDAKILAPYGPGYMTVVLRTDRTASDLLSSLRAAVRDVDPKVPVARIGTLGLQVRASMARLELTMRLLVIAAAVALLLGIVGVYGVVAFAVSQRSREFGVRLAVGASPAGLAGMVIKDGIGGSAIGLGLGLVAGAAFGRALASWLDGVKPADAPAYGLVAGLLLVATVVASYLPARRASRIDPVVVLRSD